MKIPSNLKISLSSKPGSCRSCLWQTEVELIIHTEHYHVTQCIQAEQKHRPLGWELQIIVYHIWDNVFYCLLLSLYFQHVWKSQTIIFHCVCYSCAWPVGGRVAVHFSSSSVLVSAITLPKWCIYSFCHVRLLVVSVIQKHWPLFVCRGSQAPRCWLI